MRVRQRLGSDIVGLAGAQERDPFDLQDPPRRLLQQLISRPCTLRPMARGVYVASTLAVSTLAVTTIAAAYIAHIALRRRRRQSTERVPVVDVSPVPSEPGKF